MWIFFFQHNHMNPAATLPCPWGLCHLSLQLGRSLPQNCICWRQKELTSYFLNIAMSHGDPQDSGEAGPLEAPWEFLGRGACLSRIIH